MRALVMEEPFDGPDRTAVQSVPVPEPGAGEVTIDVAFAGVNFIDVMARRGDPGYATGWPFVPGLEVAGRVRQVGVGVRSRTRSPPATMPRSRATRRRRSACVNTPPVRASM
jgi:NADPH:quinone reductase